MKPLILLSVVCALSVLSSCKKEAADAGATDKKPSLPAAQRDTASKPHLPAAPSTDTQRLTPPPVVTTPPERSKELAAALALADPTERDTAIHRALRDFPPASAADLLLAAAPTDPVVEKILGAVLTNFAIEQPAASATWLSAAPEFSGKTTAIRTTADLWQRMDYAATLKWIDSLPAGPNRQSALSAIAAHFLATPGEHRSDELNAIGNPRVRREVEALIEAHGK